MSDVAKRNQLKCFVRTEYIGNSVIQTVREQAHRLVFGDPKKSIQYMENVVDIAI